jgi:hypothetical protein
MKTVQGMVAQYFIMRNNMVQIVFVNAGNKLKGTTGSVQKQETEDKSQATYAERKREGVKRTAAYLEEHNLFEWKLCFEKSKKKDDLADCFLQALWYLDKEKYN